MSLARTESECTLGSHQHVAGPVNGFDQRSFVGVVFELRPQTMYVDVKGVFFHVCGMAPASLNELLSSGDQAPVAHEGFEQFKLLAGKGDFPPFPKSNTTTTIERDPSHLIPRRLAWRDAPCNGADSREEYLKDERLNQIVVCSQIKRLNDFGNRIDGSQDKDRRFAVSGADLPQNFKSVHFGKENIQQCGVEPTRQKHLCAFPAVVRDGDIVSVLC